MSAPEQPDAEQRAEAVRLVADEFAYQAAHGSTRAAMALEKAHDALLAAEAEVAELRGERDELRKLANGYASDADLYADELYKAGWSDPAWQNVSPGKWMRRAERAEAREKRLAEALREIEDTARDGKVRVEGIGVDAPVWSAPTEAIHAFEIIRAKVRAALSEPTEE